MLRKVVCISALFFGLFGGAAMACEGQVGKVIFEDTFADDSGGWDLTPLVASITPPNFLFTLATGTQFSSMNSQVLTFHATEADFCTEFTLPKPIAADNNYALGLEFWAVDYNSFWTVMVFSDATVSLYSRANGSWQTVFSVLKAPSFKADPNAVNALRVTTIGGKISVYLNNQLVKAVRSQIPDGSLRFGLYSQINKIVDHVEPIKISSYKVTSGQ